LAMVLLSSYKLSAAITLPSAAVTLQFTMQILTGDSDSESLLPIDVAGLWANTMLPKATEFSVPNGIYLHSTNITDKGI